MRLGPFSRQWIAEHYGYEEGRQFRDVQVSGPFARWVHTDRMVPQGLDSCVLEDRIEYALPGGQLGQMVAGAFAKKKLEWLFTYRHAVTYSDVLAHYARPYSESGGVSMKVLVSGASGLVGSALLSFLTAGGHSVARLVRTQPPANQTDREGQVFWAPDSGSIDQAGLEGLDAVVHLAGENIASGRWTPELKRRILDSRVNGTRLLSEALAKCSQPPKVLVSASAIGYYGNRGDEVLTEESELGAGFLAEVCRDWEAAVEPATQKGIRTVLLRIGVVLSSAGGALKRMLMPFKLGLGGVVGDGKQYMSCIGLDDAVGAIHHTIVTGALSGPVNAVSPQAVTNREYTKALGKVLGRPTIFPMPAFAARMAFGEMADELLLPSARVEARKLLESGYTFRSPTLESILRHGLGK